MVTRHQYGISALVSQTSFGRGSGGVTKCRLFSQARGKPEFNIKDTTHFLLQLEKMGPLPDNAILVALDVSSLYTNIPHNEGTEACRHTSERPNAN